jgi:hypothetical protein
MPKPPQKYDIPEELLERLLAQVDDPKELLDSGGLLRSLMGRLVDHSRRASSRSSPGMSLSSSVPWSRAVAIGLASLAAPSAFLSFWKNSHSFRPIVMRRRPRSAASLELLT